MLLYDNYKFVHLTTILTILKFHYRAHLTTIENPKLGEVEIVVGTHDVETNDNLDFLVPSSPYSVLTYLKN